MPLQTIEVLASKSSNAIFLAPEADLYRNPGPIQFAGPCADTRTLTLELETGAAGAAGDHSYVARIAHLRHALAQVQERCRPGCSDAVLTAATCSMNTLIEVLGLVSAKEEDAK